MHCYTYTSLRYWKFYLSLHSYNVGLIPKSWKTFYINACYFAWFLNIPILIIGSVYDNYELQLLSLVNMILLSFILIRDTK